MTSLLEDLRFAVRLLLKTPSFALVSTLTLALAIGANTALFSLVNGALLQPLPYPQPDRLVQILRGYPAGTSESISVPKFFFWKNGSKSFESLTAYDILGSGFNLTGQGNPERIVGSRVSGEFFRVFRAQLPLGRDFLPEEDRPGAPRVVILSDALWRRRFGADPGILGKSVRLNDEGYTVVGVAPPSFRYPSTAQLWAPLRLDPASEDQANYLLATGRLKSGASIETAQAELTVMTSQYRARFPDGVAIDSKETFLAKPLQEFLYGRLRPALLVLLGAVGLVLLIACVNLANLQLARAGARQKEIAVRVALGATAQRIARQLLTESVLIGLAGGLLGLLLSWLILGPLMAFGPDALQGVGEVHIDPAVLAFTLATSVLTGVLFGLMPALQAARTDMQLSLKDAAARSTSTPAGVRTRRLLVIAEVALAVVLLVGAGLLIKSFAQLRSAAPGFDPSNVLTAKLSLPEGRYGSPAALERFQRQVLERLQGLPGVQAAAFSNSLPLEMGPDLPFVIEGRDTGTGTEGIRAAQYRAVTPGFFEALKIGLVKGRALTEADGAGAPLVVVINEAMARKHWPGQDPVGQRITLGKPGLPQFEDPGPREIIGVVRDVREQGLEEEPPAIAYVPPGQVPATLSAMLVRLLPLSVVVRSAADPAGLTRAIEREIWAVDSQQPITNVLRMEEIVSRSLGSDRFNMLLLGVMAGLALALAAIGIYGVLSYLVGQRTQEIGVRVALGASTVSVLGLVIRQGMVAVGLGALIGLGGAFALTRLLEGMLHGVSTLDPLAFLAAPAVLLGVALVATYLPARRAARVDPMIALRCE